MWYLKMENNEQRGSYVKLWCNIFINVKGVIYGGKMLLNKNGIRRTHGVSLKRIWERCHCIPICIYYFEEDE